LNYDKIGDFIKKKRKENNLTQKELAKKLGVTDRAVSKWERGLGCPDVSILEILSNELGCSILELLKGREIENEVIPITEADDYLRNGMYISKNITKNKFINIINKIIIFSILFIVFFLLYLNICQIVYTDKIYVKKIDRDSYKRMLERVNNVDNKFEIIKNKQGIYSNDDYKEIINYLEEGLNKVKSEKIYDYIINRKDIEYKVNDLVLFVDSLSVSMRYQEKVLDILEKYTDTTKIETHKNAMHDNFFAISDNQNFLTSYLSYQYKNKYSVYGDEGEEWFTIDNKELSNIIDNLRADLSEYSVLLNLIIEVGEIDE